MPILSNLLWAANGINRTDQHTTAPSAHNTQSIDIYVALSDGLYLYNSGKNCLIPVLEDDIRGATGFQSFVKDAPVNLIYVLDVSRAEKNGSNTEMYAAADAAFIGQNVYLYCASANLATVVRGAIDRPTLAQAMHLRPDQKVILAQSIGYPK